MLNKLYSRGLIVCAHDILMAAVSFVLSVYLRIGLSGFEINPREWVFATLMFTLICACVFWSSGLYRGVWRYASLNDLWAITKAVTTATLIFAFVMFIWVRLEPLPRSVLLINWFVLMALLGGPRFFFPRLPLGVIRFWSTDDSNLSQFGVSVCCPFGRPNHNVFDAF